MGLGVCFVFLGLSFPVQQADMGKRDMRAYIKVYFLWSGFFFFFPGGVLGPTDCLQRYLIRESTAFWRFSFCLLSESYLAG
jgi:hypothetical protein